MSLTCLVGYHSPRSTIVSNQGLHFSTCRRCRRELVHSGRSWRRVPKGLRVVWKARAGAPASAPPPCRELIPQLRERRELPRLEGLVDMIGAALRVLLWAGRDRWQRYAEGLLALAHPAHAVLRLPAR
ncbi:MAG: hypothetical protein ACXWU2_00035 [Allosphingosinicella sp.]